MPRRRSSRLSRRASQLILLIAAAALRLPHADWDAVAPGQAGLAAHPDERYILGVAQAIPFWGDPCAVAPDFPYGHLTLYLVQPLILAAPHADPLYAARLLAALLSLLTVALTGAIARRLSGPSAALPAAATMALAPLAVQHARFYTADVPATLLASASLWFGLTSRLGLAALLGGTAVACKASFVWLLVPWLLAASPDGGSAARAPLSLASAARRLRRLVPAALAYGLTAPWSLLHPLRCWQGPWMQALIVGGRVLVPYTLQYAGTLPYLYPLAQMALWGLGPAATVSGLRQMGRALGAWRRLPQAARAALRWTLIGLAATGGLYAKFPRYFLPLYPAWAAWSVRARRPRAAWLIAILTLPLGLAQASLYTAPHPWVTASRWLYAHLPADATVAVEAWDHPLPVPLPGEAADFTFVTLPVYADEGADKTARLDAALEEADVIILASRRGYGAMWGRPDYARTVGWYRRLFDGRRVVVFTRCPHLGPLALSDDPLATLIWPAAPSLARRCGTRYALRLPRLDESFRVYDAPTVILSLPPSGEKGEHLDVPRLRLQGEELKPREVGARGDDARAEVEGQGR